MASETWIQGIVHKLEEGGWVKYVRLSVVVAFCLFMVQLWMFRANGFKRAEAQHARNRDHQQAFHTRIPLLNEFPRTNQTNAYEEKHF